MTRPVTVAELYDDEMSDAYHVGQIDARNRRPRRIDLADTTPLAIAYHHGYDSRSPELCPTCDGIQVVYQPYLFGWDRKVPCPSCQEDDR